MKESAVERAVCQRATRRGWLPIKLNGPGDRGKPDRLFVGPGGRYFFAEFKRPGGKVRPLQQWFLDRLSDLGHECHVIDNKESGLALFD